MSDPLSLIQTAYGHFGRGDIPAMFSLMNDDVAFHFVADRQAPYTAHVVGKAQLGEWFGSVAATDDIQLFEPRRFFVGNDHVTVLGFERTVSRRSGKSFECEWVHVWSLRDGRIAGFWGMLDSEAAARAR